MSEISPDKKPWHQQEGEPDKWYALFTEFLQLGPLRMQKTVFEKHKTEMRGPTGLRDAAQKWKWTERANSYDKEINEAKVKSMEDVIQELRQESTAFTMDIVKAGRGIMGCTSDEAFQEKKYSLAMLEFIAGKGNVGTTVANLFKAVVGQKSDVVVTGKQVTIEFKEMERE